MFERKPPETIMPTHLTQSNTQSNTKAYTQANTQSNSQANTQSNTHLVYDEKIFSIKQFSKLVTKIKFFY